MVTANINLSTLNGANGFTLVGAANGHSGWSVSGAGDVNGDGFDDLSVGSLLGATYVVFGKASGFTASLNLSALDGANGFQLDSGPWVRNAGDVNGDGIDDLIVGADGADPNGNFSGASYVVFGKVSGFAASLNVSTLNGANGFRLEGVAAYDFSGGSVSTAGDVNGDGIDDLIVGAIGADLNGSLSGASYVVFGKRSDFAASINLSTLDGTNGFRLEGVAAYDRSGWSVSGAGDVNGDGFDDLIIGARLASPNGHYSGESYVVFGKSSGFAASINLSTLDGANGFRIEGAAARDFSGTSVSAAGDVNGDSFDDLIVGADGADSNGSGSGASYVVFGQASGFASSINLSTLDGTNGFRLAGVAVDEYSGHSVSAAGDVNGDGFDDLIVGAPDADANGNFSGATYVLFGKASGFAASINLSTLDGTNGFRLAGAAAYDFSGESVSGAGDVNGDGFADLIVGAPGPSNPALHFPVPGMSYVVFGGDFNGAVTYLGTSGADSLAGTAASENFVAGLGNDSLTGGSGNDYLSGGAGTDTALFNGNRADYTITGTASGYTVSGPDGADKLASIERLQFSDKGLAFDLGLNTAGGNTVRIIGAAFDTPNIQQRPDWVGIGLDLFDSGMSMLQVCELVLGTPAYLSLVGGASTNEAFVNLAYENVVGAPPSDSERALYVGLLQGSGGSMTQAELLVLAANVELNAVNINLVGLQQSGVEFV